MVLSSNPHALLRNISRFGFGDGQQLYFVPQIEDADASSRFEPILFDV
jgi:hypothetical protein